MKHTFIIVIIVTGFEHLDNKTSTRLDSTQVCGSSILRWRTENETWRTENETRLCLCFEIWQGLWHRSLEEGRSEERGHNVPKQDVFHRAEFRVVRVYPCLSSVMARRMRSYKPVNYARRHSFPVQPACSQRFHPSRTSPRQSYICKLFDRFWKKVLMILLFIL